jgi:serine protease Do
MDDETTPDASQAPEEAPAAADPPAPPAGLVERLWPRRRTWIVLGRTLGGFGAFIAALVAATQFVFGGEQAGTSSTPALESETGTEPYTYGVRTDDSGTISVEVPTAWGNVDGGGWAATGIARVPEGAPIGHRLIAAPNVSAWLRPRELTTPGVFVGVSQPLAAAWKPRELAGAFNYDGCRYASDGPLRAGRLVGWSSRFVCDGSATRWVTSVGTTPDAPAALVVVQMKLVSERDDEAYERVLATLAIDGA